LKEVPSFRLQASERVGISQVRVNLNNAPINVIPEVGREGEQDDVLKLTVHGNPKWGILANFEHTCWPQEWEV